MPIFLDEVKATLKKLLTDANSEEVKVEAAEGEEEKKPEIKQKERRKPKLNFLSKLIGLDVPEAEKLEEVPTLPAVTDLQDQTKAIIYSYVNV